MISAIIPTLNAEVSLAPTLGALIPAVVEGLIREVIVVDGGSTDHTLKIADQSGAQVISTKPGRGLQLQAGAAAAKMPWLLFLHSDTVLESGFERAVDHHIDQITRGVRPEAAASFRFRLDDSRFAARIVEAGVELRSSVLKLPYGDQGLLISRTLYADVGGYSAQPIMEDVAFIRRLGRKRLTLLNARAVTSAVRYRNEGYLKRVMRNQRCLFMYAFGASPERIARHYKRPDETQLDYTRPGS
jgi:rSAM/selenodomain-associated transferase 2